MRIKCTACALSPISEMKYCHECGGLGYIERFVRKPGCDDHNFSVECPLRGEAMIGGWECSFCGDSGPLSAKLLDKLYEIGHPSVYVG